MKTKKILLFMATIALLVSCKKDPVEGFTPILSRTGAGFVTDEAYTDRHRQGITLEGCEQIGWMAVQNAIQRSEAELPGNIHMVMRAIGKLYRDEDNRGTKKEIEKRKEKIWKDLIGKNRFSAKPFVNEDFARICPIFASHIEIEIKSYVVDTVYFGGGVDNTWLEESLSKKMNDTIQYGNFPDYIVCYYHEVFYYFFYFAVDPANYREAKAANLPVPTIPELMELYPYELISSFETVEKFREWSKTKADYTKPNWKPIISAPQ